MNFTSTIPAFGKVGPEEWDCTQLLEKMPVAVYTTDADGHITYCNPAAKALWGTDPIVGEKRWCGSWKMVRRDGSELAHEDCATATLLQGRDKAPVLEAIAIRPNGSSAPFTAYPSLLHSANGAVIGAVTTLVENRTDETETRLAAVIESTTDAVITKDLNGIIASWNKAAEVLYGYTSDETVGQSITILIPHDRLEEEKEILRRVRAGDRIETYETIRKRKDGTLVPVELTVSPMRDATGRIFGASKIARDVSYRKESEHRIRMLMREVNHRVKNQYAVILSMIRETGRRVRDPKDFERQIRERIMALSASHDLLVSDDWRGTTIFELILAQLRPFNEEGRVTISGPSIKLRPSAVQYLGIALHELAANSMVYGVLSRSDGRIAIEWNVATVEGVEEVTLVWSESGGPEPLGGSGAGFGTVVLERITPQAVGGTGVLDLGTSAVTWTLRAPLDQLSASLDRTTFSIDDQV